MKNFPSSLIKQKNTKQGLGENINSTLKNIGSKVLKNIFSKDSLNEDLSIDNLNSKFNTGYETLDIDHEIDTLNINKFHKPILQQANSQDVDSIMYRHNDTVSFNANIWNGNIIDNVYFEDPFLFSSSIFSVINNYKYILKSTVPSILEHPKPISLKDNADYNMVTVHDAVSPSLFNPWAGVSVIGITEHVPLIISGNNDLNTIDSNFENGFYDKQKRTSGLKEKEGKGGIKETEKIFVDLKSSINSKDADIYDCTIKKLVEISNKPKGGQLGLATYRYADFMFCKDLGKISNNHLITLRKFPGPIGDNIFQEAFPGDGDNIFMGYPDIGRLVTWFGNEDNKLEDICKFNYKATWKELKAEIQPIMSEQKDTGIIDQLANTFSPQNNKLIAGGFSSNTGLLRWASNAINIPILGSDNMNDARYNWDLLGNYDQHRIYEPNDTIWDTHKYEGKLEFNQEITLTFRYVLRSYSNINPKSAFLDLLANILTVTYRRGSFWGGETKIIGPQGNNSVYKTANAFIDKTWDQLGGAWTMIKTGQFNLQSLQGWISNAANAVLNKATENSKTALAMKNNGSKEEIAQGAKEDTQKAMDKLEKENKKYGWTDALKGMLKNQLGRPAMYAANSLLSGEPVGPWHLTIGNPRNPIMSMGNMILENSEIQQSGPLGIDDFPSEIKVTITLKHGRPRDSVEIQKMYTRGRSSIYKPMNMMRLNQYRNNPNAFGDVMNITNLKTNFGFKTEWLDTKTDTNTGKKSTKIESKEIKMTDSVLAKVLRNI